MVSAMQAIPPLTGTEASGFNFSIFTGDLTSHDTDNQYSRAYVEYAEVSGEWFREICRVFIRPLLLGYGL